VADKKATAGLLEGVAAAERKLADGDSDGLEAVFPEGHPLRVELLRIKEAMGGTLADLPAGHPIRVAARQHVAFRKVKEDKERKSSRNESRQAEDRAKEVKAFNASALSVNAAAKKASAALQALFGILHSVEKDLGVSREATMVATRLYRGTGAMIKMIGESRIKEVE